MAEPITGWRHCSFTYPHFINCGMQDILLPRKRLEARCKIGKDHLSPELECSCGIYAYVNEKTHDDRDSNYWDIAGEFYLWGKVIQHEFGFRAQYAYPKQLYVYNKELHPLVPYLEYLYGIPIQAVERKQALPVEVRAPEPRIYLDDLRMMLRKAPRTSQEFKAARTLLSARLTQVVKRRQERLKGLRSCCDYIETELERIQSELVMLRSLKGGQ